MTTLEAGLLTGGLGGLISLASVVFTLVVQGRQQRGLARDERMWSRRAETYVTLLQYQGSGMAEGYVTAATAREWAVMDELTAKAAAFASDEVRNLWQQSALASLALGEYVGEQWPQLTAGADWMATEDAAEMDPQFRSFRQASTHASKQLAEQIRAELDVGRRGRPRSRQGHMQQSMPASVTGNPAGQMPPAGPEEAAKSLPETLPVQLR